jgi:hypothetical protein
MSTIVLQAVVDGTVVAVTALRPQTFKTGSKGYWGQLRFEVEGRKHIANINAVEIGSKPADGQQPAAPAKTPRKGSKAK